MESGDLIFGAHSPSLHHGLGTKTFELTVKIAPSLLLGSVGPLPVGRQAAELCPFRTAQNAATYRCVYVGRSWPLWLSVHHHEHKAPCDELYSGARCRK